MTSIEEHLRSDGGTSCIVRWRLGGTRAGKRVSETFSAGTDAQNRSRADSFRTMVNAAGEFWPDGWVRGRGFVRDLREDADEAKSPRSVEEVGREYVRQIVDCSPGQRSRYQGQLRLLKAVEVWGRNGRYRPFDADIAEVTEADVKAWLIGWQRSMKTNLGLSRSQLNSAC